MHIFAFIFSCGEGGLFDNAIAVTVVAGTIALAAFLPTSLPIFPPQSIGGTSIEREGRSLPFTLINVCNTVSYLNILLYYIYLMYLITFLSKLFINVKF